MKNKNSKAINTNILRERAEELLKQKQPSAGASVSEADLLRLIHELQVHQIELEMQNEELIIAKERAEASEEKYTELYDFAPTGYVSISSDGVIVKLNLKAAELLGQNRQMLINQKFAFYLNGNSFATYTGFLSELSSGKQNASCEISFKSQHSNPVYIQLTGELPENREHYHLTLQDITKRKNKEIALQESEVQYRNLANAGLALIWTSGTDKRCNYFNETWLRFVGRTLAQEIGDGWVDGVHPEDKENCFRTYVDAFNRQQSFEMEYRLKHFSGEYRWIIDLGTPNYNSAGEFIGYIGHCFDISERKTMEKELHLALHKFKTLFTIFPMGITVADKDGQITESNLMAKKLLGLNEEEVLRRKIDGEKWELIHPDGSLMQAHQYASVIALRENKRVENVIMGLMHQSHETTWLNVSAAPIPVEDAGVVIVYSDISERKRIEDELKETLDELNKANLHLEKRVEQRTKEILELSSLQKAILANAPIAILTIGNDGTYQSINPFGEKLLGYESSEFANKHNPLIFYDRDELVALYQKQHTNSTPTEEELFRLVLQKSFHATTEWTWVKKNGEKFPVRITHSSITDENGIIQSHLGLVVDITQEKQYIESLLKSEFENRAIIKAVPDPMFRINRNGIFVDTLSQSKLFAHLPSENFIGKNITEILPPELAALSMQFIENAFISGKVEEFEFTFPNGGKDYYFENRIIAISKDEVLSIIRDITQRKESENALRLQSAAFESFSLPIIITDIEGKIQWVNSAFTKLSGFRLDEVLGNTLNKLVKSGKQDKHFYQALWSTLLSKNVWSGELINQRKEGSLYFEEETITPVLDSKGNITNFIAIKIDISERKRLYQELANEKRRLADIIKGTNVGTWEWNIQTGEVIFNEQWAKMVGYTLEELAPISIETWEKLAHPVDLAGSTQLLEKHFSKELDYYSYESRMKHKNGEWIWVLDRGRVHEWDTNGNPKLMAGTHLDITERKKADVELQWNKSFLELMSNSSPLGFLVVDNRNDEILYFNQRFCEIWEIEHLKPQLLRGELKNKDIIPHCLPVLTDIPAFAESCLPLGDEANRVVVEDEISFTNDRTTRRFSTQIRGENDEYYGRFYIFEDITIRKRTEEELLNARIDADKANIAKSEFLSRMSHELRTPLNSILGFAQLMEMGEIIPSQKKGISYILSNGKHLLSLINEVLDISGIEAGRQILSPETINLDEVINEITDSIQLAANHRKITISIPHSSDKNLFILADNRRIRQVLINLLTNAIKYNNQGGSIYISTSLSTESDNGQSMVRISIKDTGIGIRPDDINKIFQPFERIGADKTEIEGTGLGLVVVKKLTEAMGGRIGVESEEGIGSTFWIEFPQSENPKLFFKKSANATLPQIIDTPQLQTILYIEDSAPNIELVKEILNVHKPEIQLISSMFGKKTLSLAKEHRPSLILLDLNLPDIHGIQVFEQLSKDALTKDIPVIIISADAMTFQMETLLQTGVHEFLTKPIDVVLFLKTISKYLIK